MPVVSARLISRTPVCTIFSVAFKTAVSAMAPSYTQPKAHCKPARTSRPADRAWRISSVMASRASAAGRRAFFRLWVSLTETDMLNLERESFMRLLGERKTLERMESLLKTGKPLRN